MTSESTRIGDLVNSGGRSYSFEFFPPKNEEGEQQLWQTITELEPYNPTFVSVTYGAGGGTRDLTVAITERIARETSLLPMAHLTCVSHTSDELGEILGEIAEAGVDNVLALRGDPPGGPGTPWESTPGGFEYAYELVDFIQQSTDHDLSVGVAAFPEGHRDSDSLEFDAEVLKAKQDAGAEFAVTEMVLRTGEYFRLCERARAIGVTIPIIPGIMPILNINSMKKMAELSGLKMPQSTRDRIEPLAEDPTKLRAEGIQIAIEQCDELLSGGAPGLHFYTLNRSKATREIWQALDLAAA